MNSIAEQDKKLFSKENWENITIEYWAEKTSVPLYRSLQPLKTGQKDVVIPPNYYFVTNLVKSFDKCISKFHSLKSVQTKSQNLLPSSGLTLSELSFRVLGDTRVLPQGSWLHSLMLPILKEWLFEEKRKKKTTESIVRDRLQSQLGGQTEVVCSVGRIDLLTNTEIIEVKEAKQCLNAIGQLLVYSQEFPSKQKRIHLFGEGVPAVLKAFEKQCKLLDIIVTYEQEKFG